MSVPPLPLDADPSDPIADPGAEPLAALARLVAIVAQLRSPEGGCPWDLAQTPESLLPYLLEETYETVAAIRSGQPQDVAEELGDLLLQVVLQAQIASETGAFNLADVAQGIADKLVRRHPHVFGDDEATEIAQIHETWERIKAIEKGRDPNQVQPLSQKLARYARQLPPMLATLKISTKAAKVGFEWEDLDGVWAKFHEELDEFRAEIAADDRDRQEAELGDLLFSLIQVARWQGLDPEAALHRTNQTFIQRLAVMEAASDRPLETYAIEELEALWQRAKQQLRQSP